MFSWVHVKENWPHTSTLELSWSCTQVLAALTPDQGAEVLRNSPCSFDHQFKFLPPEYRHLAAHAANPGVASACSLVSKPPPPVAPSKNPFIQLASWGLSWVTQPDKVAHLTLVVDGCKYVQPPGAVTHGSLSSLPELREDTVEDDDMATVKIWPECGETTKEDLEYGLFFLREGSGGMSCRMRVNGMSIDGATFQLKHNQAALFDSSCSGLKLKNVTFEGAHAVCETLCHVML